jgi:hypothetical protein
MLSREQGEEVGALYVSKRKNAKKGKNDLEEEKAFSIKISG